jgi:hypothetical protein
VCVLTTFHICSLVFLKLSVPDLFVHSVLTVVSRLEISGAIYVLPTYVFMVWTGLALCSNILMNDILLCLIQ